MIPKRYITYFEGALYWKIALARNEISDAQAISVTRGLCEIFLESL